MTIHPDFKLNSGNSIPSIAIGTYQVDDEEVAAASVFTALKYGYRHIDTAKIYRNEAGVGAGIRKAIAELGIKREEIFLTTKLWLTDFHHVKEAFNESLEKLFPGDEDAYIDLYLIHWPFALLENGDRDTSITYHEAYAQLEEIPRSKLKDIGVSNFSIEQIKDLLTTAKRTPAANQIELNINVPQHELVEFLLSGEYGNPAHNGKVILPEGYSPLDRGNLEDPTIARIAEAHKTQPANVVISWGIARHTVPLPKSVTPARIKSNLDYIELTEEEIKTIDGIAAKDPKKSELRWQNTVRKLRVPALVLATVLLVIKYVISL